MLSKCVDTGTYTVHTRFGCIEESHFLLNDGREQEVANSNVESGHGDFKDSSSKTSTDGTASQILF